MSDIIGNVAAAAYVGVTSGTWRSYVSRGFAPRPYRREPRKGFYHPVWDSVQLDLWMSARPGPGRWGHT